MAGLSGAGIPEKLSLIRQHLQTVKAASGQATGAFSKVEKGSEQAAQVLTAISNDVFEAGLSNRRWALTGAGQRAEERLGEVVEHHDQVVGQLDTLFETDPTIQEALDRAKAETESLGLPSNSTWLLRTSIDSAKREEDYAVQATDEIDKSLAGMESELNGVLETASEVGKEPQWRHGYGHRGRRERHCNTWNGQSFRERWQARIYERRQRAKSLDESTSRLDNPFRDIDRSAERGARHQAEVVDYADQALRWVDQLEQEYLRSQATAARPRAVAPPSAAPVYVPILTDPVPAPTIESRPAPPPASVPSPPPAVKKDPPPRGEGFFTKPWGSK